VKESDLTREALGDAEFENALRLRVAWCKEQCLGEYAIASIREGGKLVGREFLFADKRDATLFKLWFL
jgi:hypothetical protein